MQTDPTWRPGDELISGCPDESGEASGYLYPGQAEKLAEEILAEVRHYGDAYVDGEPRQAKHGAHPNRHLDGYGDPRLGW